MPEKFILRHVLITILFGAVFFFLFLSQYPANQRLTIFFLNKAIAQAAVVLLGLSFLLGPLCKILPFLVQQLHYRRYFGLAGFGLVLLHILTSLLQLGARFPLAWYLKNAWGVVAAILATLIFLVLALTSTKRAIEYLGARKWETVQRIGYIALFLALIHIFVAASPRWQLWLSGKVAMPTSFLVFVLGVFVIVARVLAFIADRYWSTND